MAERWKYPFYVIALVLLVMWLTSCGGPAPTPFAATVHVATADGAPVEGAPVAVRPCNASGAAPLVTCTAGADGTAQARAAAAASTE
jgi:hypothetical protein